MDKDFCHLPVQWNQALHSHACAWGQHSEQCWQLPSSCTGPVSVKYRATGKTAVPCANLFTAPTWYQGKSHIAETEPRDSPKPPPTNSEDLEILSSRHAENVRVLRRPKRRANSWWKGLPSSSRHLRTTFSCIRYLKVTWCKGLRPDRYIRNIICPGYRSRESRKLQTFQRCLYFRTFGILYI